MAITFNYEVNNKPNKKGLFAVFIRVTQDRKKQRLKTSVELKRLTDWNKEKQCVRASDPDAKVLNLALEKELERAKAAFRSLEDNGVATSNGIVKILKNEQEQPCLLAFSKSVQEDLYNKRQLGSWQKYGTFVNELEGFLTHRGRVIDVPFKSVDVEFIEDFTSYLNTLENHRTKGRLHPNTIAKLQRTFRAIINRAVLRGYIKPEDSPFRDFKITEVKTSKERLDAVEVEAIKALELEPYGPHWNARNAFFFSYYCAGIRAGDLMQLRWCNITPSGRLQYQMGKNHKPKDILLVDQAKAILDYYRKDGQKATDYIFPYLNSRAAYAKAVSFAEKDSMQVELKKALFDDIHRKNVQINRRLRTILQQAGIEKHISFHISRHTFAKQAKLAGTDNAVLKDMLSHSSLNVTERYMGEFDTSVQDQALEKIFTTDQQPTPATDGKEALLEVLKGLSEEQLRGLLKGAGIAL